MQRQMYPGACSLKGARHRCVCGPAIDYLYLLLCVKLTIIADKAPWSRRMRHIFLLCYTLLPLKTAYIWKLWSEACAGLFDTELASSQLSSHSEIIICTVEDHPGYNIPGSGTGMAPTNYLMYFSAGVNTEAKIFHEGTLPKIDNLALIRDGLVARYLC